MSETNVPVHPVVLRLMEASGIEKAECVRGRVDQFDGVVAGKVLKVGGARKVAAVLRKRIR